MNTRHKLIKGFLHYLAASVFIGVPATLLNGFWPTGKVGWIIILLCAFPALVLSEFLWEKLLSQRISERLDPAKKNNVVSVRRMAYALIMGIAVMAFIVILAYLLRDYRTLM